MGIPHTRPPLSGPIPGAFGAVGIAALLVPLLLFACSHGLGVAPGENGAWSPPERGPAVAAPGSREAGLVPAVSAAPPEPAAGAALSPAPLRHEVRAGETLWRIARRYGADPERVARANGIVDTGALQVGAILTLPGTAGQVCPCSVIEKPGRCAPALPAVASSPPSGPSPAAAARPPRYAAIDRLLGLGDRYLESARFVEAADLAELALDLLGAHWMRDDAGPRIARAELLRGVAQVALGRPYEGRASFRRALRVAPDIRLGSAASPKVREVFDAARREALPALARP